MPSSASAAEGKNAATLVGETKALIEKWESSWKKIARNKNVQLLFTEYSKTTTILRDLLNESFSNIWINDEKICDEARKYIAIIAPEQEKIVHLYEGSSPSMTTSRSPGRSRVPSERWCRCGRGPIL